MLQVDSAVSGLPVSVADAALETSVPADEFHPMPYVMAARGRDATVLMDRRTQTYYKLDTVGSHIWELIAAHTPVPIITASLLDQYAVSYEQVAADVAATVQKFLSNRLVAPGTALAPEPASTRVRAGGRAACSTTREVQVPSVLRCEFAILAVKLALKRNGFSATLRSIARRVEDIPVTVGTSVAAVRATEYAVALAGGFYPGRAKCLEQSLALYSLLRRQGVQVKYCQGVQFHPFEAHAWVEYQGEPLNDVAEHVKYFTRFPDQLP